ncbi:MAG: outer membrane protein [Devosia sp.]
MRKFLALAAVTAIAMAGSPTLAADMLYPEIEIPPVDQGMGGNFYLRGSMAGNAWWAKEMRYRECPDDPCGIGEPVVVTNEVVGAGYGYSIGAGIGYETGDGLRADLTLDYLSVNDISDGVYDVDLRSTLALANVYYDFPISGVGQGYGLGGYVGAGLGFAHNQVSSEGPNPGPEGKTFTAAGAVMAGLAYDMGAMVADVGYRGIYMPQISNGDAALAPPALGPYFIDHNMIHELRGTVRYRLQ